MGLQSTLKGGFQFGFRPTLREFSGCEAKRDAGVKNVFGDYVTGPGTTPHYGAISREFRGAYGGGDVLLYIIFEDMMIPYVHFIPVRPDMKDLVWKVEFAAGVAETRRSGTWTAGPSVLCGACRN